jgi:hypothetical protein
MDESTPQPAVLSGRFVNLYEPRLYVVENPTIAPDTRWLLVDLSRCPDKPWVIAAAGRVSDEAPVEHALTFTVAGMAGTTCAVRVALPAQPIEATVDGQPCTLEWDAPSRTALLLFPNEPRGVNVTVNF